MRYRRPEAASWTATAWAVGVWGVLALFLVGSASGGGPPEERADPGEWGDAQAIAQVRAGASLEGPPAQEGAVVTVRGRVSAGTGTLPDSTLIFVQDGTAGIAVGLPDGPPLSRGDSVRVRGVVRQRYGLTRLQAQRYERVRALPRFPAPVPLTVSAVSERFEGRLVRVQGRVVANRQNDGGQYLLLTDAVPRAEARVAVFVPRRRFDRLRLDRFAAGDDVTMTGVLAQHDPTAPFDGAYQVLPRDRDDLEGGTAGTGPYPTVILLVVGGGLLAVVVVLTLRATVRRRTEQLRESRARFRRLAEATEEGIVLHRDGDILDVNRAFRGMTGHDRGTLEGRPVGDVLAASIEEAPRPAGAEGPREAVVVRTDGTRSPVEVDERRVDASEGRVWVVAIRDITDRKRREADLVRAKEEAEEMARVKSSLLDNMSHEVRTPVTSILGYADLILEDPAADHEAFARRIRRSGRRLSRTLRSVLTMAQLEAGTLSVRPERGRVEAPVRAAVEAHRARAAERGLSLRVEGRVDRPVRTDHQLLRRIVDALVHNAVKFTPEGAVRVTVEDAEGAVRIAVADTGIGIDPAAQSALFEPFTQASDGRSRTHEGMGLGLSIVQHMVDLLDGRVAVESTPGDGSTVTVRLPGPDAPASSEGAAS